MSYEEIQQSIRSQTGTSLTYEEDWHALFDLDGIAAGTYNDRLRAWINVRLSSSYVDVNDAMRALAVDEGFDSFGSITSITPLVSWQTMFDTALTSDATGFNLYTTVSYLPASLLTDLSGDTIRVTITGHGVTASDITEIWIGSQGGANNYSFTGDQVQLKYGAAAAFTIPIGTSVVLDDATFTIDGTAPICLAVTHGNANYRWRGSAAPAEGWYIISGGVPGETSKTGYTLAGSRVYWLAKIEVFA